MSKACVKFYYDIGSFHSWLLFEQLCAAERCFGLNIQFYPVRMASIYTATGHRNPYYVLPIRNQLFDEVEHFRKLYNVPFVIPTNSELKLSYIGTDSCQRFLTYIRLKFPNALRNTSRFLWRRLWVKDEEVYSATDFDHIIRESDLPAKIDDFSDTATETALKLAEKEAVGLGCFDVPFTVINKDEETTTLIGMDTWPLIGKKLDLPLHHRGFYSLRAFNHLFDRSNPSRFN